MKKILGILLFSLVSAAGANAAGTEWKAGLATVNITPERPVPMAGYASRTRPFEKVEQDIYAKALALEDRQGHRAVLVTTDLLGLSRALADPVCARIQQKTKLARSDILLNSAHTHSAPMLTDQDRTDSGVMPEDARNLVAYTRSLQDKLVEVATEALSRLEPAHLSWSSGVAHFAMNRREFTPRGVILGVNPRGLVDRTVPVLRVDSAEGKLRAVLFGYACHNTTLTQTNYNVCGDYAGFAQAFVQERQPGVQAMFMIGCGGDANPSARVLQEGGYECRGLYTTQGFFAPAAQDVLIAKVRELAQRAGRKLPSDAK